jgi:uncharacterized protein YndB with AHSA1/START domain
VVAASPARIWRAIVDGGERGRWWPDLFLEPRKGGRLTERWTGPDGTPQITRGEVLAFDEDRLLRLRWADEGWVAPTDVELRLEGLPGGTRVLVRESGWEQLPGGDVLAEEHRAGWRLHLAHLARYVQNDSD